MLADHKKLYGELMNLCNSEGSSFYFVDQTLDDKFYRIFSYRLASYTEFLLPGAMECRGIMFEVNSNGEMIRLASLPMAKFFNKDENPMTMDLDYTKTKLIMDKLDGSLISTFWHNGKIHLKSKTSLHSEQAVAATEWLYAHPELYDILERFVKTEGYTVNLEWTAKNNRIVIGYLEDKLTVLNIRQHSTGNYANRKLVLEKHIPKEYLVVNHMDNIDDKISFVNSINDMKGIEGYVLTLETPNGDLNVKIKCNEYCVLHKSKDSVNSPRALYECVVSEAHDDLRAMFHDDEWIQKQISIMEDRVKKIYAQIDSEVISFYNENKLLDRKSYAILGQEKLNSKFFGVAMSLYVGKEVDYKQFLIKNYKEFGITDEVITNE